MTQTIKRGSTEEARMQAVALKHRLNAQERALAQKQAEVEAEHEVWHRGQGARIVLLINFWHPDVPPQARRPIDLNSSYVPS